MSWGQVYGRGCRQGASWVRNFCSRITNVLCQATFQKDWARLKEGSSGDVGCFILGTQMSGWLWDSLETTRWQEATQVGKASVPLGPEGAETVSTLPEAVLAPVSTQDGVPRVVVWSDHSVRRSTRSWVLVGVLAYWTLADGGRPEEKLQG